MSEYKFTVLGSGGWIPTEDRHTCSYMLEAKNTLILLDSGTGISRLKEHKNILEQYDEVHLILSHYHMDHIMGLVFLPNFLKNHKLNIYAPSKKYYEQSSKEVLTNFTSYPYFPFEIDKFAKEVKIHDYDEKGFMIDDINIKITKQVHSAPSFGITIDDFVHYATDTSVIDESFKVAKDVKYLLHECWAITESKNKSHSSLEDIQKKAILCENTKIGLIHINPSWEEKDFYEIEEKIKGTNIFLMSDKMVFN